MYFLIIKHDFKLSLFIHLFKSKKQNYSLDHYYVYLIVLHVYMRSLKGKACLVFKSLPGCSSYCWNLDKEGAPIEEFFSVSHYIITMH